MLDRQTQASRTPVRMDIDAVVAAIRSVTGRSERPIALHEPTFAGNEWAYLKECLDSGYVSSVGGFVERFERMTADAVGSAHAIAVVNGTAALHVALRLTGVSANDEVIVPALTFIATANAVSYCGAVPHFVDSSFETLGLDPQKLRAHLATTAERRGDAIYNRNTGRRIAAIVPMHMLGIPVHLTELRQLADEYRLPLVEDLAEALGSRYRGESIGKETGIGALSFNGNKIATTGGGGAIVTNDPEIARHAKHLTTTAKLPHKWAFVHDEVAYNYRLPNINAALGCAQLEQLPDFVDAKRRLADRYRAAFAGVSGIQFVSEPNHGQSNYWLNAILVDDDTGATRDEILNATHAAGLLTRPAWTLMPYLPIYSECPRAPLEVAESIERRLVKLPSSPFLGRRP